VLLFARHEGKRRDGCTWWVIVAGEETGESLSTWLRAAAAAVTHQSSERERRRPGEGQTEHARKGVLGGRKGMQ
jgi:hypothetical protein